MQQAKEKLARGELVLAAGIGRVLHHNFIHIVGIQGGFDCLWLDHEHVGFTTGQLEVAATTARSHRLECFVRIPPTDYATVTRAMEAGAGGIMAAQVQSAEHAEEIVRWAKFAPRGRRGLNTGGWDAQYTKLPPAEFCRKANAESFVAIQIETLTALEECDQIAAIDGVDVLFVGPADLSQSLGCTGEFFDPKCIEAFDRVAAACKKHGKHWGAVSVNSKHAEMLVEKGCGMLSPTADLKIVIEGLGAVKQQYAKFFA